MHRLLRALKLYALILGGKRIEEGLVFGYKYEYKGVLVNDRTSLNYKISELAM